eukprot:CAMPEP_0170190634 /NCGR_PEP_ID=MMETSP0040_2-20121228/49749_1 /TAXON_ID=641309 /ORGANISM="Lotharella oceanica, Strain CCMP622" /LENGTH=266 /DNA_ID=CAMNT_0010438539 /DNA_START=62 /DNA_END=862 /DNA_ORIENTATION=-
MGCGYSTVPEVPEGVLIVATNTSLLEMKEVGGQVKVATHGAWLESIVAPYRVFKDAGLKVTIASLGGGAIPIDTWSLAGGQLTEDGKEFYENKETRGLLMQSIKLASLRANIDEYDAIFLAGGHGALGDFANSRDLGEILKNAYYGGVVIGGVSQGLVALCNSKDKYGSAPLVRDITITGSSSNEEKEMGYSPEISIETRMKKLGAKYVSTPTTFHEPFVASDDMGAGFIVSGQNAASSRKTAEKVMELVRKNNHAITEREKEEQK